MANVPYDTGVSGEPFPTVAPRTSAPDDTQKIRATPEETGGLVAQGLQQAGAGTTRAATFFGQVAADNASNDFQDRVGKVLYGDPSKTVMGPDGKPQQDTGYFGLKGRAALDARPGVQEQIDSILQEGRNGLQTPEQQLQFDNFSRRWRSYVIGDVGRHADQEASIWYQKVGDASANLAATHISRNPDNAQEVAAGAADLIAARVRSAQLAGASDEQLTQVVDEAKAEALSAQLRSIAIKDPARATTILDKNKDIASVVDRKTGVSVYDTLATQFRQRATLQTGISLQRQGLAQTYGAQPPAPAGSVTLPQLSNAIEGQESDYGRNARTSATGAVGPRQIEPATFQQYAQPGEAIDNPKDNRAVGDRILADYYQRYGGDPYRVAVAYYSGPGNVAPPGSATPWINNVSRDRNGNPIKPVSAYVSDVAARLGVSPGSPYSAEAANERYIMTSDAPDDVKQYALNENARFFREAQIASEGDAKARKDANDAARDTYTTQIFQTMQTNPQGLTALQRQIELDPRLEGPTKIALSNFMLAKTGTDEGMSFGAAYPEIYRRIFLPPGDPQRINDPNDILVAGSPGGGLTPKGTDRLSAIWRAAHRDPDQMAINQTKTSLIQYAKSKLSFDQETLAPGFQLRDPKGAQIFDSQFVPKFESAYDAWIKAGKNPWEFLTQKNVDELMKGMRPKSTMDADRIAATGQLGGEGAQAAPMPEAPQGVTPQAWHDVLQKPPVMGTGQLASPQQYGMAISLLAKDPTPEAKQRFNKWFGTQGAMADDILGKLGEAPTEPGKPVAHREPESGGLSYSGTVPVAAPPEQKSQPWYQGLPATMLPPELRPQ